MCKPLTAFSFLSQDSMMLHCLDPQPLLFNLNLDQSLIALNLFHTSPIQVFINEKVEIKAAKEPLCVTILLWSFQKSDAPGLYRNLDMAAISITVAKENGKLNGFIRVLSHRLIWVSLGH